MSTRVDDQLYMCSANPAHNIIQRAGRLVHPNGRLVLSMSANPAVQEEMLHNLDALQTE